MSSKNSNIYNRQQASKALNGTLPLTFDEGWSPVFAIDNVDGTFLYVQDWTRVNNDNKTAKISFFAERFLDILMPKLMPIKVKLKAVSPKKTLRTISRSAF